MKISELSERSGVSVASIKYYVREGLLPAGVTTAANQANYDDHHIHRLRLIRALVHVGNLSIASVKAVLDTVDSGTTSLHDAFGAVMHSLDEPAPEEMEPDLAQVLAEVRAWIRKRKWAVSPDAPAIHLLAEAMLILRQFDFGLDLADLDEIADVSEQSAEFEVGFAREKVDRTAAVETMLIGTVVYGRALVEIRRLALEAVSARLDTPGRARPKGKQ
ncbi:unannotated protein [freshwater metagenome]|uniref:Unannotated protein n=1 Tax=freshwater metagenome TaxID=449393 RepID=A0A6J7CJJ2_9ZZZZ|nr:MerR family transcriptional regulator [Actinomycetota bacterium]